MSLHQATHETVVALAKAAPSIGVAAAGVFGLDLHEWVYVVTIIYTALQSALLVRKYFKEK